MLYFTLFAAILYSVAAQQRPTITYITKERVVNIGDTVELQCSVQYATQYSVNWVRLYPEDPSQTLFVSSGSQIMIHDQRFSLRYDEGSSTYTLQITKLQEIDAGIYQCQLMIGVSNRLTADVWVHIRIPPVISDSSTRSVMAGIGDDVTLECYAHGYPPPRISWRRQNNALLSSGGAVYYGSILNIFNITKNDRGTYYCAAENGISFSERRNIGVEVYFRPEVTADRTRYGQALQNSMDLLCHIEAFPQPTVEWVKDNNKIIDNQDYLVATFTTDEEYTDSTLTVKRITSKQYGTYKCIAKNKFGEAQKEIELYETAHPVCPPACDMMYLTAASSFVDSTKFLTALFPFVVMKVI